jgi:hypothetical protein
MEHNNEYTIADLSKDLETLILAGLIEVKGLNADGEMLYGLSDEYKKPKVL